MPFRFLKYVQPTHYFALRRKDGTTVFPIASKMQKAQLESLIVDNGYQSKLSQHYDISWQAIVTGCIGNEETYKKFEKLPVVDEYRFLRKNFHFVWSIYVMFLRIFSFKNPVKEVQGFLKNRNVKRVHYADNAFAYKEFSQFKSHLLESHPLVTVVIPTLNRYPYLQDVLKDFELQTYANFEVIVVDQSTHFKESFYNEYELTIKVIRQIEPALWLARNTAIKNGKGNLIAFSEDDVRIPEDWLENHLKCLDFFKSDISAGVFFPEGGHLPKERSYFTIASQFATGNAMVYKDVFHKVGLFDRQFERQRMGDGEFGLRCYLHGLKSISNPLAYCLDVKAEVGGLRQMGSWDAFRTKKWFAPRPIPSVLYLYRRYYGKKRAILNLLKSVPPSIIPYQFKRNKVLLLLGIFVTILFLPLIVMQVAVSWYKSSKKLKEGALIETID